MFEPAKRLVSAGYRVFFFLAGAWAVFAMTLWEVWVAGLGVEPYAMAPSEWHAHELIFGYGSAALAGFLLTAAPNWTKARDASALFFAVVSGLWVAGRLALWLSGSLPLWLVAVVDLSVLPVVAGKVLGMLLKRPKPPQMLILAAIALVWVADLLMHLDWLGVLAGGAWPDAGTAARAGLLALAALIVILGGRVTPAFTRNAMIRAGREERLPLNPMKLAAAGIAPALLAPVALLAGFDSVAAGAALVAGLVALVRVALWRGGWTLGQPILWVLHLGYALTALGLALWGLAGFGTGQELAALHLLAIGGGGGMILAVMSRAALVHSGRALVAPRAVALAYGLVPVAAGLRMVGALVPGLYLPAVLAAGAVWVLAFALYTGVLMPVFWGPKVTEAEA